jgi:hypothetical protein
MHSRFLAFLLDPKQNHGLGDRFLNSFLRTVSESTDGTSLPQVFDRVDDAGLHQTTVHTEAHTGDGRIDILLLNQVGQWAMIVENKVWTTEHSEQLDRYYRYVKQNHPDWQVFGVYLTPFADACSHAAYHPFSYRAVCEIVAELLEDQDSTLNPYVWMSMEQYKVMVRRNIVGDSDLAELCQSVYRKHQRAFDMVFQHRFTRQRTIRELLTRLIRGNEKLIYNDRWSNYPAEEYVTFGVRAWDSPALHVAQSYTKTDRILLFSVWSWTSPFPEGVTIYLEIGSGDSHTREKLFNVVKNNRDVFEVTDETQDDIAQIYKRSLLTPDFYENTTNQQREEEIRKQWDEFLDKDLPRIEEALKKETWIWEPEERSDPT